MCPDLKGYIFDCGKRGSAEQAQKTMERIAHYCGKHMNMDISKELTNRTRVVIPKPECPPEALEMQDKEEIMKANKLTRLMEVWEPKIEALTDRKYQLTLEEQMELAKLLNEVEEATFEASRPVEVKLTGAQKKVNDGEWKSHRDRTSKLEEYHGQAYSLAVGQFSHRMGEKCKQHKDWAAVEAAGDPLMLFKLIDRMVMAHSKEQYPFATVYKQHISFFGFQQGEMSNMEFYDRHVTRSEVDQSIGIQRIEPWLLDYMKNRRPKLKRKVFEDLDPDVQIEIVEETEEAFQTFAMLVQASKVHDKLKEDLQNFYATGDDKYPKKRTDLVHVLDQYTKKAIVRAVESQGSSFANTGGRGNNRYRNNRGGNNHNTNSDKKEPYDKKFWADKECRRCHKKGHPAEHCRAANPVSNSDKDKDKDKKEERSSSGRKKSSKE